MGKTTRILLSLSIFITFLFSIPSYVFATPGELNTQSCHYCTTNCRDYNLKPNEYHCHENQKEKLVLGVADKVATPRDNKYLEEAGTNSVIVAACAAAYVGYKLFHVKSWQ